MTISEEHIEELEAEEENLVREQEKKEREMIKELVIARIKQMPDNFRISIG